MHICLCCSPLNSLLSSAASCCVYLANMSFRVLCDRVRLFGKSVSLEIDFDGFVFQVQAGNASFRFLFLLYLSVFLCRSYSWMVIFILHWNAFFLVFSNFLCLPLSGPLVYRLHVSLCQETHF